MYTSLFVFALLPLLIGGSFQNTTETCPCSCSSGRDGRDGRDGMSIQGPSGRDGAHGVDGRDCVECAKGPTGARGAKGDAGKDGKDGKAGAAGKPGDKGPKGDRGDRGIAGVKGIKGDRGERGDRGVAGSKGEKGEKGEKVIADKATVSKITGDIAGLREMVQGLQKQLQEQAQHGDAEVKALRKEVDELKKGAVKIKGGKIEQHLLPGGYSDYSVVDLQWQALHMAAATGCRAVTATGGAGDLPNRVFPRSTNLSCMEVCRKTPYKECDAELSIQGRMKVAKSSKDEIGVYFNYGCEERSKSGWPKFEPNVSKDAVLNDGTYISYCCCH